jgi:protein-S-isoprenylcysteine O-methyltransferase Ste14
MTGPLIWIVEACWAVFLIVWAITSFQAKTSVRRGLNSAGMLWRIGVLVVVVILAQGLKQGWIPRPTPFPYGVQLIGLPLVVAGIAFAVWARFTLGSNWGMPMTLREKPELVTGGPYAFVRHPIYTGIIFAMLGTGLVFGAWWLIILIIAFGYFLISTRQEEKDMVQHFPDAYPAYRARTKRLIPFVF